MKILGLLRHAKSDWDDMAKRDFDRGLNNRGRKGAQVIGEHIRDHGVQWETMLASPAARVKQTIEAAFPHADPQWVEQLYLASGETILDTVLHEAGDADCVLVIGHNPGLQEVLFELIDPKNENALFDEASAKFPTAAFAVLECDIEDWTKLMKGCGTLVHFARPRDLDPELGPER